MIENLTMNFSKMTVNNQVVIDLKEVCSGTIGTPMMIMIAALFFINFSTFFFYKNLKDIKINLFNKEYYLLFFVPVLNVCVLAYLFVYAYNAF